MQSYILHFDAKSNQFRAHFSCKFHFRAFTFTRCTFASSSHLRELQNSNNIASRCFGAVLTSTCFLSVYGTLSNAYFFLNETFAPRDEPVVNRVRRWTTNARDATIRDKLENGHRRFHQWIVTEWNFYYKLVTFIFLTNGKSDLEIN